MSPGNDNIIEQLETYLHKALAEFDVASQKRKATEALLEQAKDPKNVYQLASILENAKTAAQEADNAYLKIKGFLQPARDLVKKDEANPDKSIINIKEIKELREFRDLVNIEGQAAEEAYAARQAVTEIEKLINFKP